jgi:hypothetical protein
MGSMSASDAAPLPRLGEVYFDVRGESRSMRLSWYADTGVAVFSIWQGGTCTGTFRLPIADLPRMVEALRRGPHGEGRDPREARGTAEQRGRADRRGGHAREPGPEPDTGSSDPGFTSGYAGHPPGYGAAAARDHSGRADRGHRGEPATAAYREGHAGEYPRHGGHAAQGRQAHARDSLPDGYPGEPGGGYRDEPGGRYPGEPGGYGDEPAGRYPGEPGGGYGDEPGGRYREPGYREDPLTGRYPADDPRASRQPPDPLGGSYHENPRPARYPEGSLPGGYPDGPHPGDYPAGRAAAGYPGDKDSQDYPPDVSGNTGYSPVRPYVAPLADGGAAPAEERRHGRGRAPGREESDLSSDSFPYGTPQAEREPRGHGR